MSEFARLLEKEIPRLRRYARALVRGDSARADDIVQSCLTRAVAKQHLWEPGSDLRAWLFTILHNQFVNDVRRSSREGNVVDIEDAASILTTKSNAMASLELRDLEIALNKLPHEQRQVILLVGLEGMGYDEAASILQVPIGTVRSRLSRGRDQLRQLMGMEERLGPQQTRRQRAWSPTGTAPRRLIRRGYATRRSPSTQTPSRIAEQNWLMRPAYAKTTVMSAGSPSWGAAAGAGSSRRGEGDPVRQCTFKPGRYNLNSRQPRG